MPSTPSTFMGYFRFKHNEAPREEDLNAGLVDKIDANVNAALQGITDAEADIANLSTRMDAHADEFGNLIAAPPEFTAFAGGSPTFIAPTQFYVVGNWTSVFTLNRAVRMTIAGGTPASTVKLASYDGGTNRTTVELFDAILDATLSAVDVGFIQYALPKISIGSLDFDPATQAELDAHKTAADHNAGYVSKALAALQSIVSNLRIVKAGGSPAYEIEDTAATQAQYRIFRLKQEGQIATIQLEAPSPLSQRNFWAFDGGQNEARLLATLNANSKALVNLPAPTGANDAARKTDVPVAGSTPTTAALGDAANGGAAATFSKNDHRHGMPGAGTPVTQAFGDTPSAGSQPTVARSDHRHGMPSPGFNIAVELSGNIDVNDTNFQTVMSTTITLQGNHRVRVTAVCNVTNTATGVRTMYTNVLVDGVNNILGPDGVTKDSKGQNETASMGFSLLTTAPLSPGPHTVELQLKTSAVGGSGARLNADGNSIASLYVEECPF